MELVHPYDNSLYPQIHHTGLASEYSTFNAVSVERITMRKASISNYVIVITVLGKSNYEFVATIKPYGISSNLINPIIVFVRW